MSEHIVKVVVTLQSGEVRTFHTSGWPCHEEGFLSMTVVEPYRGYASVALKDIVLYERYRGYKE